MADEPITEKRAKELADVSFASPFHTVGKGPTQAAPGNHQHEAYLKIEQVVQGPGILIDYDPVTGKLTISSEGAIVTDHGTLTGLGDDDHPQYLNTTRANAAYSPVGHSHSYAAASHTHSYSPTGHTHTYTTVGFRAGNKPVGTLPGSGVITPISVAHGLGKLPVAVVAVGNIGGGGQAISVTVRDMDSVNVTFTVKNLGTTDVNCSINWIAIG